MCMRFFDWNGDRLICTGGPELISYEWSLDIRKKGRHVDDLGMQGNGPIEFMMIGFARGRSDFSAEVADEFGVLTEAELIRILQVEILAKDPAGAMTASEISDDSRMSKFCRARSHRPDGLSARVIEQLATRMPPSSSAGLVVWENVWTVPIDVAVRSDGGYLVSSGRVPDDRPEMWERN
jgi:hypothetical protein